MAHKKRDRYFIVRNILNILFMVIAAIGVYIYLCVDEMKGTVVIIFGMLFKMAESCIRLPILSPKRAKKDENEDENENENEDDNEDINKDADAQKQKDADE